MKKLIAVIALASGMGAAYADQPVALTDTQMDNVSAGALIQASSATAGGTASAVWGYTVVNAGATTNATVTPLSTSASSAVHAAALGYRPSVSGGASAASVNVVFP